MSRILVVEDDPLIRLITADILRDEGHEVDEASDGAEGLEALAAVPYDAIVLDMCMPGVDGRGFADAAAARGYHVPVLLMTASDITAAATQVHADAYLAKPFDIEELLASLSPLLHPPALAS